MVSRRGEFDALANRFATTALEVLCGPIMDELVQLFPALREQVQPIAVAKQYIGVRVRFGGLALGVRQLRHFSGVKPGVNRVWN